MTRQRCKFTQSKSNQGNMASTNRKHKMSATDPKDMQMKDFPDKGCEVLVLRQLNELQENEEKVSQFIEKL